MSPLGLYLHVPFCGSICHYCNFNRGLFDAVVKARYVEALAREVARAGDGSAADTIYFGGGTPSLLEPDEVGRLIAGCRQAFDVTAGAEVTLEVNPEDVTVDRITAYRAAGVTRISMGVQSLLDEELTRLGRRHDAARARAAVVAVREAGITNLSLDLMLWLPGQALDDWRRSVEGVVALAPEHVSLYLLELYPNAPLRDEMARRPWSLAPDDDAAEMYLWAMGRFDEAGYEQYEISNVARPGHVARHNVKYWADGAWLGFGCGAHSTRGDQRWANVAATGEYIARVEAGQDPAAERRARVPQEQLEEALFLGLRLASGVDLEAIGRRYQVDVWARYGQPLGPHISAGRLRRDGSRLALTREGMLVASDVMAVFV